MAKKLNFIDLFAGAGGLSCGLEMAGLNCLLGVDFNKYAMETFAVNHQKSHSFCGPIQELTNKKIKNYIGDKKVDLVVGGPPCQGFSTVGLGNPEDERNSLFLEFCRVVKFTRPSFVVLENVTGLLAKKNEKTLISILKKFKSLGYNMEARVLQAQHYGVPESRRRTILIGSKINSEITYPRAFNDTMIGHAYIPPVTVGDALKELRKKKKYLNHDIELAKPKTKLDLRRIKRIPEGAGIRYKEDEKKYFTKSLYLGVDWDTIRENRLRQKKYFRLDRKKTSPTIMTHRHTYFHPTEDRYLTQREAALLQSFPLDFEFKGPLSAQWKQIGNAVPPLLAKAIGKAIIKMNKDASKNLKKKRKKAETKTLDQIRSQAFLYK